MTAYNYVGRSIFVLFTIYNAAYNNLLSLFESGNQPLKIPNTALAR
jgi:hypothetical protein